MSYLLTEIALEMLGYKFYDTNGMFNLTNFQQSMSSTQSEVLLDEPSLQDIIDQPEDTVPEQKKVEGTTTSPAGNKCIDLRLAPVRTLANIVESDDNKIQNGHEPQKSKSQVDGPITSTGRRVQPKALEKILTYECESVRNQVAQRLELALRKNPAANRAQLLEDYLQVEKTRLMNDAKNMKEFRVFVEDRLHRIDSRPYKTYLKTFSEPLQTFK